MSSSEDEHDVASRRSFLFSSSGLVTSLWIASQWPLVSQAAHHAEAMSLLPEPAGFEFLTAAEAADVDAISAQIVPSGATPGARETHVVRFIDRAMATFFAAQAADFRAGLGDFQAKFLPVNAASASFAESPSDRQMDFLKSVESTPFFGGMRTLTLLGMFSSPKYGGNFQGAGWKMMGFADQHAFAPPFGYYDREYAGFVPYSTEKPS